MYFPPWAAILRPARIDGGLLVARATIVKRGKTIALCDLNVHQNGEPVAKGLFTYRIRSAAPV